MKNNAPVILIFSGYNQRAVIAFIRTLHANKIDNYVIIARKENDKIIQTSYKDKVFCVRREQLLVLEEMQEIILEVKKVYMCEKILIAPSTEALNRFLLQYRKNLEDMGCIIPLVNDFLYKKISDKESFGQWCSDNGMLVPCKYEWKEYHEYPIVAKPKKYFSANSGQVYSPVIIQNEYEYYQFKNNYPKEDFYYQEFISGRSVYLLYYFYRSGDILKYSQENIAQQPGGKSIVAAYPATIHDEFISDKYEMMLKTEGFNGFIMIELRIDGEKQYMIEANPRFWGPSQLFVDNNINFFEAFLYDYGVIQMKPNMNLGKNIKYFWSGGIYQTVKNNKELVYYKNGQEDIFNNLPQWIECDIYRRRDTEKLFIEQF